jgi:hypothetical protein
MTGNILCPCKGGTNSTPTTTTTAKRRRQNWGHQSSHLGYGSTHTFFYAVHCPFQGGALAHPDSYTTEGVLQNSKSPFHLRQWIESFLSTSQDELVF